MISGDRVPDSFAFTEKRWYDMGMNERVGILGAMDAEIDGIISAMSAVEKTVCCGSEIFTGSIGKRDIVLARSGIGKVNAAFAACLLAGRFGVSRIYMTGVAGGLGGRLHTLDALVPDGFVQYDVIKPGDPDGFIDILGDVVIRPDEEMSSELASACGGVRGLLATGERFVGSADDKADIMSRFPGVLAADMESAAVAQVCTRLGVPFACIRIISDEGDISEYYDFKYLAADKAVSALLNVLK